MTSDPKLALEGSPNHCWTVTPRRGMDWHSPCSLFLPNHSECEGVVRHRELTEKAQRQAAQTGVASAAGFYS